MRRIALARRVPLLLFVLLGVAMPAAAGPREEIRALYQRFAAAQNSRDLAAVRDLFVPAPSFLWVSDGMSFWGPDAVIERMASFQEYEIWRVDPDLPDAVAVEIDARAAYLHLPLALTFGSHAPGPNTHRFLVSVLGVETPAGWRIAALFTTAQKPR